MRRLRIDFETMAIVPGLGAPPIVCMSHKYCDGVADLTHARTGRDPNFPSWRGFHRSIDDVLYEALIDDNVVIEAYHAAFEFVVALAHRPDWAELLFDKVDKGLWQCIYYREKQIRIARGDPVEVTGLDDTLLENGIDIKLNKLCRWRARYGELLDTPISDWPEEATTYALEDLAIEQLSDHQLRTADPEEYVDHIIQMSAARDLQLTSCHGFMTDLATAEQLVKETDARLDAAEALLLRHGLARVERKKGQVVTVKTKKAAEARMTEAFADMGLDVPRNMPTENMMRAACEAENLEFPEGAHIKKILAWFEEEDIECLGNICLDAEACEESRDHVLEAWSELGSANTLRKRVGILYEAAKAGKPIQASYNAIVDTGRTSCRQGNVPEPGEAWTSFGQNIQNLPRAGEEVSHE